MSLSKEKAKKMAREKCGVICAILEQKHGNDDLEAFLAYVAEHQAKGTIKITDTDVREDLRQSYRFVHQKDEDGWTIRDYKGEIRQLKPTAAVEALLDSGNFWDYMKAYHYVCGVERDAMNTEPAYRELIIANWFVLQQRFRVIDSMGSLALDMLPLMTDGDTDPIVMDMQEFEAACRFRKLIKLTDDVAETILEQIGVDTPTFERAFIQEQADHITNRYVEFLNLGQDLVEEAVTNLPEFIDRKSKQQEAEHKKRLSAMRKSLAKAKNALVHPISGLDDASAEELPNIRQLREIVAKHESDMVAENGRYDKKIAELFSRFRKDNTDDWDDVKAPSGNRFDLNTPAGVQALLADLQEYYKLGTASVDSSDIPDEGEDSGTGNVVE